MICLGKEKFDDRYNISDDCVITDLRGNVKETRISQGRELFHRTLTYRILMYTRFGWRAGKKWIVHHIDGNSLNNHINNLVYMTRADHMKLHGTGRKHSEETKQKIAKGNIGKNNTGIHNPMFGRHHSSETKMKISLTKIGKPLSEETKRKKSEAMKLYWANKRGELNYV